MTMANDGSVSSSNSLPGPPASPLVAVEHQTDGKFHLLLACTGSVATIKLPCILNAFSTHSHLSIRVILTRSASRFLVGQSAEQPALSTLSAVRNVDGIHLDTDEWSIPWIRRGPILHIELRRWADLLVIAPLGANTLAKIAGGLCDDLLTSVVRAWEVESDTEDGKGRQRRIVAAPAMNTAMWRHPLTTKHVRALQEWPWMVMLRPVEKTLACGDTGDGAMMAWQGIVEVIQGQITKGIMRSGAS